MDINNGIIINFGKLRSTNTGNHDGTYTFPIAYTVTYSAVALYISDSMDSDNDIIIKGSSNVTKVVFRGNHTTWHFICIGY